MSGVQLNYYRQSDKVSYNAAIATSGVGNRVYNPYSSTNQTEFWDYIWVQGENSAEAVDIIVNKWKEESVKEQCESYKAHINFNINEADKCLADLKERDEECKTELKSLEETIQDLETNIGEEEKTLADAQTELAEASDELAAAEKALAECLANPECTAEDKNKIEKEIEQLEDAIAAAQAIIEQTQKKIAELESEMNKVKQQALITSAECGELALEINKQITAVNALYCCEPVFAFQKICDLKGCASAPQYIYFAENPLSAGNEIFKGAGIENEGDEPFECCYRFTEIQYNCSNEPSVLFQFEIAEEFPANDDPCNETTGIDECKGAAPA